MLLLTSTIYYFQKILIEENDIKKGIQHCSTLLEEMGGRRPEHTLQNISCVQHLFSRMQVASDIDCSGFPHGVQINLFF